MKVQLQKSLFSYHTFSEFSVSQVGIYKLFLTLMLRTFLNKFVHIPPNNRTKAMRLFQQQSFFV